MLPGCKNEIWLLKMYPAHNEKWVKRISGKNRITESIKMLGEKENYKYLEILETDTIKQTEMKEE